MERLRTCNRREAFINERDESMIDLGLNKMDLFNGSNTAVSATYKTSKADIIERETRKLEAIAKRYRDSKDPAERAELAVQVDQQLEVLRRLETGL